MTSMNDGDERSCFTTVRLQVHNYMRGRTRRIEFINAGPGSPEGAPCLRVGESLRSLSFLDSAVPDVVEDRVARLSAQQASRAVAALAAIDMTLVLQPREPTVYDGWTTTLEIAHGSWSCALHWFCDPPPTWRGIASLVDVLQEIAGDLAPHSGG